MFQPSILLRQSTAHKGLNMRVKNDHRSKFSNLSNWKEEAWKKIRASTGFEPVTSALPVRCSTNWATKPHIGSEVNLLSSYLSWGVKWCEVYEIIHVWTAVVDESEELSTQYIFQFKQLERRSLKRKKKSGLQRDSNPSPPRCWCVALPTELWSHTLGARSIYWVHISREEWNDEKYTK